VQAFRPAALVGSVLDGRYRLRSHLATGGMGDIFRAEHVYMRKELALKLLRPELSALPDIAERFRREAEIAASLEHENIVRVTDFGRTVEGWLFLVMELLEGESLFERMRAGGLPPEDALPILAQVCEGLEAAHARGVVHRDLKPENVFLVRGARPWVKLLDFGIAKITDPLVTSETAAGVVVGTPEYVSPEQASGAPVDARADVYAVGLVAWSLLAGRHPFVAVDSRQLLMMQATQEVPPLALARPELAAWPRLVEAVARSCAKDPDERFQSAGALRDALLSCLPEGARAEALAPPRPTRGASPALALERGAATTRRDLARAPWPGRRRSLLAAAALAVALALLGGGFAWLDGRRGREAALAGAAREEAAAREAARAAAEAAEAARARQEEAPLRLAEAHLAAGRARDARAALAPALARDPADPRAQLLLGRALRRIPGEGAAALAAFEAAARPPGALDEAALADVAATLAGPDRRLADRAARLLAAAGPPALPHVVEVTLRARGAHRLRLLGVLRSLRGEARIAPAVAYGPLLADPDCEVRRQAARRLGELGDRAALPRLAELSRATRERKGLVFVRDEPVCGAAEALAAMKRIEAVPTRRGTASP
jgi:serine/threonine-protein kinase